MTSTPIVLLVNIAFGLVISTTLQAQWTFVSETARQELGSDAWKIDRKVKSTHELTLSLISFNTRSTHVSLEMQDSAEQSEAKPLSQIASSRGAIAACNGGFFSPDFGPAGLEIISGVRRGEWTKRQLGGTLYVKDGNCYLTSDESFQSDLQITGLVQCSPLLVSNGTATFNDDGNARLPRTFIATDGGDQWIIGMCQKASLGELATALASQVVIREFKVKTALNLDGGPSSCLWWKPATGDAQSLRDGAVIRNVFLVCPK